MLDQPDILARFRGPGYCELCGVRCRYRDAAHIFSVGAGRVDAPWNLLSLGSHVQLLCKCHRLSHDEGARLWRHKMLLVAARRERTTPEAIHAGVAFFRMIPRRPLAGDVGRRIAGLSIDAYWLVFPYLEGVL